MNEWRKRAVVGKKYKNQRRFGWMGNRRELILSINKKETCSSERLVRGGFGSEKLSLGELKKIRISIVLIAMFFPTSFTWRI